MGDQGHGGQAVARALKALDVQHLFTLTGGHIFPILDGCHQEGISIVDFRHEQSATFAAEGWARLTRSLGVAALTAGPGITNAMSALAQARFNRAPLLALGGRAPEFRWGQGSLQEIDHVPFVDPIAPAATVAPGGPIAERVIETAIATLTAPRGPRFLDFPLDALFNMMDLDETQVDYPAPLQPQSADVDTVVNLLREAQRPILIAGSNVYMDRAEKALLSFVEACEMPTFVNGQGRGCIPADHRLAFARARSKAFKGADLVVVAGTPMDFRLGFGQFESAKVVHLDDHPDLIAGHVDLAGSIAADLGATFSALGDSLGSSLDTKAWVEELRSIEDDKRDQIQSELRSDSKPIHPMRVYGELVPLLDRDAVVIGDGGDFVSYAGREVPSFEPGSWLDPGPFGCLGVGPGYAAAARLAHPDRQIALLYGDGAFGFSGMELETLVRHKLPVVCVVGNNGIWGLEKHPMQALYGYDVAAELRPGIPYDQVMVALGGQGETIEDPAELAPALKRAFDSGEPYLVNVITDPEIAYPRSANLA
ncbi:MAG: acetolactate synthase [Actinomycetota bacterium]